MELAFVISALRKRLWIIGAFTVLGVLFGVFVTPKMVLYSSSAGLVIRQPVGSQYTPERYLATELNVLSSSRYIRETADQFEELGYQDVASAIDIVQNPETDTVRVVATTTDAELSTKLANTYAKIYLGSIEQNSLNSAETEKLKKELYGDPENPEKIGLIAEVNEVNKKIAAKVNEKTLNLESVDPELDWLRTRLTNEIETKEARLNDLAVPANVRLYEEATRSVSLTTSPVTYLIGGGLAGMSLGLFVALLWARFSSKVLDEMSVTEILESPVVAEFDYSRNLSKSPLAAFTDLPKSLVKSIDQLCVRAESKASLNSSLIVAVVGVQRGSAATALSLAMSKRFAASGSRVTLIDGDVRDPEITRLFYGTSDGGIPEVVANDGALVDLDGNSVFTGTMDPRVKVLGMGSSGSNLPRGSVKCVLEAVSRKGNIIVVDGGPALELVSTVQLTRLADAVVLAVPINKQKVDVLSNVASQLSQVKDKLLPVITSPSKSSFKSDVFEDYSLDLVSEDSLESANAD